MATLKEAAEYEPTEEEVRAEIRRMATKSLKKESVAEYMAEMFVEVEKDGSMVDRVVTNTEYYFVLRAALRETIEIETRSAVVKMGILAYLWGARIMVSRHAGEPVCWAEHSVGTMQIADERPYVAKA